MAALLRPFGMCAEFLNPAIVKDMLTPGMEKCIAYVQNLEEKDFKEKVRTNMDNVYIHTQICRLSEINIKIIHLFHILDRVEQISITQDVL